MKQIIFYGKSTDSSILFPDRLVLDFANVTHRSSGDISIQLSESLDLWIDIPQQADGWGDPIMGWLFHSGTETARYYNFEIKLD